MHFFLPQKAKMLSVIRRYKRREKLFSGVRRVSFMRQDAELDNLLPLAKALAFRLLQVFVIELAQPVAHMFQVIRFKSTVKSAMSSSQQIAFYLMECWM